MRSEAGAPSIGWVYLLKKDTRELFLSLSICLCLSFSLGTKKRSGNHTPRCSCLPTKKGDLRIKPTLLAPWQWTSEPSELWEIDLLFEAPSLQSLVTTAQADEDNPYTTPSWPAQNCRGWLCKCSGHSKHWIALQWRLKSYTGGLMRANGWVLSVASLKLPLSTGCVLCPPIMLTWT